MDPAAESHLHQLILHPWVLETQLIFKAKASLQLD